MTDKKRPEQIERREFLKKTGTVAGVVAAGFPGIISGQSVTNSLKVGLVGCGGRGSGAAAQALTANPNNTLTSVADIDENIVDQATTRLKGSSKFGSQVKIDRAYVGLDAFEKVIDSVDVVLLATPPGFRPQHLTAAVNANKHVFCEKPCATDSPGVRDVMASNPAVSVALSGTRTSAEIEHNVGALDVKLDPATLDEIDQIMSGAAGQVEATPR